MKADLKREQKILSRLFIDAFETAGGAGHRFYHSLRVANYCKKVLSLRQFKGKIKNEKMFLLAALFHDIGKAPRVNKNGFLDGNINVDKTLGDHTELSYVLKLLEKYVGKYYKSEELKKVANIIANNGSLETQLIEDADNLDELGYINIWKMFTYGGCQKVSIKDTIDYFKEEEYSRLFRKIDNRMRFPILRKVGKSRLKKTLDFVNVLEKEINGDDVSAS